MSAYGNDPAVHFIRDGKFVCTAGADAKCRNFPGCECEAWDEELHGDTPAEGHRNTPQDHCWAEPWLDSVPLCDSYLPQSSLLDDDEFPDGPVQLEWEDDYLAWEYADETDPFVEAEA